MLPLWKQITMPVTVLQGEKDCLVPKENANFANKMLLNSKKVIINMIPNANHFIIGSKYNEIVDAIRQILRDQ